MRTPVTESGLTKYDNQAPGSAIYLAWNQPGHNLNWHLAAKQAVRDAMPLLARALDRL